MGEAHRNPELVVTFFAQLSTHLMAVASGTPSQIYRSIKYCAHSAAHRHALGFRWLLEMNTPEHTSGGEGVIVLAELDRLGLGIRDTSDH